MLTGYVAPLTINNTNIERGMIFTASDDIFDGSQWELGQFSIDESDSMLSAVDNILGTIWRRSPSARYNRYTQNAWCLENILPLLEQRFGTKILCEPLDTEYTTTYTLATSAISGDITGSFNSTVTVVPTSSTYTSIGSPFGYTVAFRWGGGTNNGIHFSFTVLRDNVISNGKFNVSTATDKHTIQIQFYKTLTGNKYTGRIYWGYTGKLTQEEIDFLNGRNATKPDDDPYSGDDGPGGPSGGGGGPSGSNQDNWDSDSDSNPVPNLPSISATDTGFITLYNPTTQQLKALANYLWAGAFDISAFKKIMADPMDTIIGLSIVPVNVPSGSVRTVTVGNISTGISLTTASAQFVELNCGSVSIDEKWHSYLDYSPYTKISIMLPYIGSQELDIDQLEGTTLGVVYHIDILSGACVAYVTVDNNVVAQFAGQCAVSIPITSTDFTNTITSLCTLVASGIGVVASGGMSAPVQTAMITGATTAIANTAGNIASSKPTYAKSGNISGSNGLMSVQKPYIILERPKLCAPARQNTYSGYPAYITENLSSINGFTQIQDIKLDGIPCTDTERDEILKLLRGGVIL